MVRIVAFVPIKFHSERLPGKNFLLLNGKPLCYHIFKTLLHSKNIVETYVYCSDEKITDYIPEKVIFKKRSENLDRNETKGMQIYQSFVDEVDADWYVLAHATSPFLKTASVDAAIEKVLADTFDSAFSAQRVQTFCWYKGRPLNYNLDDVVRTQDIEPVFVETSGFYMFTKDLIKKNRRIGNHPWMQEVDLIEAVDIDEKEDFSFAEKISKNN
jgi:CMP-N-acetylneuraminic acid synthetase